LNAHVYQVADGLDPRRSLRPIGEWRRCRWQLFAKAWRGRRTQRQQCPPC